MPNIYVSDKTMDKFCRLYWLVPDQFSDDALVDYLVTRELGAQELATARQVVGEDHDSSR
jgi:hypothetical protein